MITPENLEVLCCPETHQPVRLADEPLVARLNGEIAAKRLKNCRGELVAERIDGALVRTDGKRAYLIRQKIPVMIADEAVALES